MENKGIEFTVNTVNIPPGIYKETGVNFSITRNKLLNCYTPYLSIQMVEIYTGTISNTSRGTFRYDHRYIAEGLSRIMMILLITQFKPQMECLHNPNQGLDW